MSCRMLIDISVTVDDRVVGRQFEDDLARIIHEKGADVGIRISYHYASGDARDDDIPDTCGEALKGMMGDAYGMGDEKPIVLGDDAGDVVHGWDDWFLCRSRHLYQEWLAKQDDEDIASAAGILGFYHTIDTKPHDQEPCPDAGSRPLCAACPHSSVPPTYTGFFWPCSE